LTAGAVDGALATFFALKRRTKGTSYKANSALVADYK
jgi:hypothetical protein